MLNAGDEVIVVLDDGVQRLGRVISVVPHNVVVDPIKVNIASLGERRCRVDQVWPVGGSPAFDTGLPNNRGYGELVDARLARMKKRGWK